MTGAAPKGGAANAALVYIGHHNIRERLILSVLSGKEIWIKKIRESPAAAAAAAAADNDDDDAAAGMPGLQQHEASFIRLLCKITVGSEVYIHPTGTSLRFRPGLLLGVTATAATTAVGQSAAAAAAAAAPILHVCHEGRGISYYLEPLLLLSPFCKYRMSLLLRGVTDAAPRDAPVDLLRLQQVPLLQQLLHQAGGEVAAAAAAAAAEIKIYSRGFPGCPCGVVGFKGPGVARGVLQPLNMVAAAAAAAPVKRIRGVAFAAGAAAAAFPRRAVTAARSILNELLPDVWVYVENATAAARGSSNKLAATAAAAAAAGSPDQHQHQLQQLLQQQRQQLSNSKLAAVGIVLVAENIKGGCRAAGEALMLDPPVAAAAAAGDAAAAADAAAVASRATGNTKLQHLLKAEAALKGAANKEAAAEGAAANSSPEEQLGIRVARLLLLQLLLGGAVPPRGQKMAILFAALAADYAPSKVLLSRLTPSTVCFLRLVRDFFGVAFTFEQQQQEQKPPAPPQQQQQQQESDEEEQQEEEVEPLDLSWAPQVLLTCVGVAYKNMNLSSF